VWSHACARRSMAIATLAVLNIVALAVAVEPEWSSPNRRYRILVDVDSRGLPRSNCPASVDVDFPATLSRLKAKGEFDEHTLEVVGYDGAGRARVFDTSRPGYEKSLLPRRLDRSYGVSRATLAFVMPDPSWRRFAVYFDTVESGVGQPERFPGIVGDGDLFRQQYGRREISACHFDCFCDFDGDGDLDLFKGGVEPFIYCYENVGSNRFVERGKLTSGGSVFILPRGRNNRSWVTIEFFDWDRDGDQDLFASFQDGPYDGQVACFENTTAAGGVLTFVDRGPVKTRSGESLFRGGWFAAPTLVGDWDGDGDKQVDMVVGTNNRCCLYRNLRKGAAGALITDDPEIIKAGGAEIEISNPRFDVADIDGDGDRDLLAGCQPGPIWLFENTDTSAGRKHPTFARGRVIAFEDPYFIADAHSAVKVADFTGDGLPDYVVGRYWERTRVSAPQEPREFGWLYQNVGSRNSPRFERRDASNGAPYTLQFQKCDAIRQNCVRAWDWDNDGRRDLLAGDTDGHIWLFRNTMSNLFPLFAPGRKLTAGGQLLSVQKSGGHARPAVCDWNNDGRKDLLVADGDGWLTLFLNEGTDAEPVLGAGQRLSAAGSLIHRGGRSSVLVCDWNKDGKKDVVFADQDSGFAVFINTGTDARPALAAAKPLGLNKYSRPNLGSFVDWDGDGKKDFIGCNFENNVRSYRNVGGDGAGDEPRFADLNGVVIVEPYTTTMMVSGADVLDFDGDGDLDILSGQGHGGGSLRFFERDYIENRLNNTYPAARILEDQARSGGNPPR
jgi:hypothetical protein